jgi:FAD/FMN-containing dehydrogenase
MTTTGVVGTARSELRRLGAGLTGSVVLPDDPEFPHLRRLFRGRPGPERLPRAVVRCLAPGDVAAAVGFARARALPFALRSGGHSFADFCTTDGLLIDLGPLASVRVDGELATVGPGIRLGPLAEQLIGSGRMVPCGWNPLVAVGGAVLGGGYGALSRCYGLGCDHLRAAQVVLADGRTVWTDQQREPDLFWALRGAGWGSFGAVTALVLRTRPARRVVSFVHRWPWRLAARVVGAWQRWAPEAPDWLNAELVLQLAEADQEPRVTLFGVAVADPPDTRSILSVFLARLDPQDELGELCELSARVAACRHTYAGAPVMATMPARLPPGYQTWLRVVRSEFFDRPMPPDAVEELLATFVADRGPGQYRELELIPWRGAYQRVPTSATAFAHRTAWFQIGHHGIAAAGAGPAEERAMHAWVGRSWAAAHRWGNGGVYPNYPDPDLDPDGWAQAYHGTNLPRLTRVKARYDPGNLFSFPHSVPLPAPAPPGRRPAG